MSRSGKRPIALPKGVQLTLSEGRIAVKGPRGALERELIGGVEVSVEGEEVHVGVASDLKDGARWHGLYRALINNMIVGTSAGFQRTLILKGVGYRGAVAGNKLELQLGFSHPTALEIPQGIEVKIEKGTTIVVDGMDKQAVGQFAATVRALRPPEPYKGKGVWYDGEYLRRKAGKAGK